MPGVGGTPEVDSAAALSRAGLQMPALGYSIPNSSGTGVLPVCSSQSSACESNGRDARATTSQLETLDKIGLANSRAARALRRSLQTQNQKETFNSRSSACQQHSTPTVK